MKSLAVIDVETTGLNPYRHDRVVEVAAVLVVPGQGVSAELATLVNPERDIGPTSIHGITASDIINAPRFADIVGHLTDVLRGAVALVGYNVRFPYLSWSRSTEESGLKCLATRLSTQWLSEVEERCQHVVQSTE
jgi:DNA polymerase-3 subunit epsilon